MLEATGGRREAVLALIPPLFGSDDKERGVPAAEDVYPGPVGLSQDNNNKKNSPLVDGFAPFGPLSVSSCA